MSTPTNSTSICIINSVSIVIISFSIANFFSYIPLIVFISNSIIASDTTNSHLTSLTLISAPINSSLIILVLLIINFSSGLLSLSTLLTVSSQIFSSILLLFEKLLLASFSLNEKNFFSFKKNFDYLNKQPKEK